MSEILWRPDPDQPSRIADFARWVTAQGGPETTSYDELWRWSVDDLDAFWGAIWRYFELPGEPATALAVASMPGASWFPDARLNYAEAMLRMPGRADDDVIVVGLSQTRERRTLTVAELRDQVARAAEGLRRLGVERGDRVAAYSPNVPETLVLLLATASLGAVFTSCAPEFGTQSVTDRWQQISPKVLVAVDGYRYGDKPIDRRGDMAAIVAGLPSLEHLVWLPYLDEHGPTQPIQGPIRRNQGPSERTWADLTAEHAPLQFEQVGFAHPLYILFSSGTTGLPKAIVHGHGGITVEHLKALGLQSDLGPSDIFFWFSTTGWMMWNYLVSAIGVGATIVMFDGNPAHPGLDMLWRMAEQEQVTYFGTSAPFLLQCRKEGVVPREIADLSRLKGLGSTGAPLPTEGFGWVYEAVSSTLQLGSLSGGTDVCSGFVGSAPTVPVYAGRIACRCLGAAVAAYDDQRRPVIGEQGELVIEQPMPSMPVGFWGDESGEKYRAAYFEDIPGVWRHGDWVTIHEDGSCQITGRSDATLNRGGVRLGTSEFYSVLEAMPQILDSIVIHLEDDEGGAGTLMLFVTPAPGTPLDDSLKKQIATTLRTKLSPRHVPDVVHAVSALPRTLSGKKLEVPVKKIMQGATPETAAAAGALANPESLRQIVRVRDHSATQTAHP